MKQTSDTITPDDASMPFPEEPTPEVRAWQEEKIRRALIAADEGRFATPEQVRKVIRKFIPNG